LSGLGGVADPVDEGQPILARLITEPLEFAVAVRSEVYRNELPLGEELVDVEQGVPVELGLDPDLSGDINGNRAEGDRQGFLPGLRGVIADFPGGSSVD